MQPLKKARARGEGVRGKSSTIELDFGTHKTRLVVPVRSAKDGHEDAGVSDNLGKPSDFRYSESFLDKWYGAQPKRR